MRRQQPNNRLPTISGKQCIDALIKAGYSIARQKGSHVIMSKEKAVPLSVPLHTTLKPGTLKGIIRDAGLSVAEFNALLS
ncbi:MAG: type II toxin-antitoxin system HicA family toxin [Abitibacteriaceae bacterium]|nr:type II toxin-antitoxin system HicA family toxin [Abditibacteriaceae bacterium]